MKKISGTDEHATTSNLCLAAFKFYFLALLCCVFLADAGAAQLGTAFTYSGRLKYKNNPADGNFDLQVKLYDDANAGNLIATYSINSLPVANGLFVMNVDFSTVSMFDGTAYWLELSARPGGNNGSYQTVSPRQPVNPTPYAFFTPLAGTANTANAAAANAVSSSSIQNNAITASKIASGQVVKSLNGFFDDVTLQAGANIALTPSGNGLSISATGGGGSGWSLTGNGGTSSANFLGTTDNHPLELKVDNIRALRLEPAIALVGLNSINVLGGYSRVDSGIIGATIAGGGGNNPLIFNGEAPNEVKSDFSTIGGGLLNVVRTASAYSTIAGGYGNTVRYGTYAAIGGGYNNLAGYDVPQTGDYSTIAGGYANAADGNYSAIPGGYLNWAPGTYSFAAGKQAKAAHNGAFVWADSSGGDYYSEQNNQFAIRAHGGVRFEDSTSLYCGNTTRQMLNLFNTQYGIGVQSRVTYFRAGTHLGVPPGGASFDYGDGFAWYSGGVHADGSYDPGAGGLRLMSLTYGLARFGGCGSDTFSTPGAILKVEGELDVLHNIYVGACVNNTSDRNAKENFKVVDCQDVLAKVANLPITTWNYKSERGLRHLGPVAQDFHAAFGLGIDEKHIATVDEEGVALAAIQGLNQKLEAALVERDARIQELEKAVHELKSLLPQLASKNHSGN